MNPYQTAQNIINQLVGIKPTSSKNTFKTMKQSIKIRHGKLGFVLYVNGKKVNYSDSEFCSLEAMRKYWNAYRVLLISGFRHTTLKEYVYANISAGN